VLASHVGLLPLRTEMRLEGDFVPTNCDRLQCLPMPKPHKAEQKFLYKNADTFLCY